MTQPILILGATSGIGKLAMQDALRRGHTVRAFARSADKLDAMPNLERWQGDAVNADDLAAALEGVGAVIYALGITERLSMLWEEETLFSRSTAVLLEQMTVAGVRRLVCVTGFGAGRSRSAMSSLERLGHGAVLGRVYADKSRQEALIVQSDLDWTIARPVILTNRPASGAARVLADPASWRNGIISRADVAAYLVDAVEGGLNMRQDVVLAR
ncbi:putative NADH-flavin reductase [Roseinatronobacter thiooxidans]|uniref:Putative NADH-flavin reductase n=1 Tax=Roseinatronobacter thiooxidans TaxID=121821 RepID=A0A2W7QCJ6_9RHOB|nr:NAD(P)-binding oxidoreductase [Roseinatronobacter thiooxidans]PZX45893.1 putative NADH-flavin reductase [Roseinatronobacter thiooxidans]